MFLASCAAAACATPRNDAPGGASSASSAAASPSPGIAPTAPTTPTGSAASSASPASPAQGAAAPATDTIPTSQGDLRITPIHHGSLLLEHGGKSIYVDPWSQGKLDGLPKADLIFVTDIHQDHFDQAAIDTIKKPGTVVVGPAVVAEKLPGLVVMKNGESKSVGGLSVEAIPMYNKQRGPSEGKFFHDKGRGNGYVFTFGDKRVYASGDTECTDEMRALKNIDVAFVCMNLPYTMPPAEAAECIKAFRPKVVYPYHYRESNLDDLTRPLAGEQGIEVRLRSWYGAKP